MRKLLLILCSFVFLGFSKAGEIDIIKQRIAEWSWSNDINQTEITQNARKWQQTLQEDQQWQDVDYKNPTRTTWTAYQHLKRIKEMTIAYTAPWSTLKNNDELFEAVYKGLQFWNKAKLKNINWWWNEIEAPRTLGIILIMLEQNKGKQLPEQLSKDLVKQMDYKRTNGVTGVNLADFDTHIFYSGLLNRDEAEIQRGLENIFSINKQTTGEGVQFDNSYAQHEIMLHIFGYGSEYLKVETYIGAMVAGTKFAMKGQQLKTFTDFIAKTLIPQIRGRYTNWTSFGRQIARENFTDMKWLTPYFEKLILMDEANTSIYQNAISRINGKKKPDFKVAAFQKQYWNTDFSFYQNKNYQFSLRMSSKFTQQAETDLNGENKKGGNRSIGSYALLQNGSEYFNIYPVWDWNKIPGTTTLAHAPLPDTKYLTAGKSVFSGGVSNGKIGAAVFLQDQFDVKAQKSWFMFDGEIVCTGNEISTDKDDHVLTTVEQNFFKDKVLYSNTAGKKIFKEDQLYTANDQQILIHRNTAYVFPQKTNLNISTNLQKGNWKELTELGNPDELQNAVFKVWIDQGKKTTQSAYQYFIIPDVKSLNKAEKTSDNFIIWNQKDVHAVYKKTSGKLMLIFFKASQIQILGQTIQADRPCAVLIENLTPQNMALFVSDPSRKEKEVNLKIGNENIHINLPTDRAFAGSSVHYKK
ncbi:silent information regulator protein Sir2 [Elizabethkingia meningoseptica]|uniref:polysaccharide lyase family 8 super-sandwich domain-containing protein n=1 Tax=Elizabethkingia meningoseptica TaxID=238 RepID=UPI000998FBFA|nr:polysaccharide lyase family 8 super-sandwich domain-containing protein [Elizabethkingia meningoseptica]OPC28947.1 silent information regulator protein Sir2 [Elizabethkingia meningoseptica]